MTTKELVRKIDWHIRRSHGTNPLCSLNDERMFLRRTYLKEVRDLIVKAESGGIVFDDDERTRGISGLRYPPRLLVKI